MLSSGVADIKTFELNYGFWYLMFNFKTTVVPHLLEAIGWMPEGEQVSNFSFQSY